MTLIIEKTKRFGRVPAAVRTTALWLTLNKWVMASGDVPSAPPHPTVTAERRQSPNTRESQPEVWLCAGDRIVDLLQPDAEWPFLGQQLTGVKLYIGQLAGPRRRSTEATPDKLRRLVRLEHFCIRRSGSSHGSAPLCVLCDSVVRS